MLKLHDRGYHDFYGGLLFGSINPNCGFHCRKCKKSWWVSGPGKIELFEVHDSSWQEDSDFKKSGAVYIGRMTIKELSDLLNKLPRSG